MQKQACAEVYESIHSSYAKKQLAEHYSLELGGNIYKLLASPKSAIRALLFGWEKATDHPAQFHFGLDYTFLDGWNTAIRRSVEETCACFQFPKDESRNILEAGCGLGGSSMQIAASHPSWSLTGVSLVPDQMRIAKSMALNRNLCNTQFIPANFLNLPFRDGFFDGIFSTEAFDYVPPAEKVAAFLEFKRVLGSNGRIIIMDGYEAEQLSNEQERDLHVIKTGWTLPKQSTIKSFRDCAKLAGLRIVSEEFLSHRIWNASRALARKAKMWRPIIVLGQRLQDSTFVERMLQKAGFSSINAVPFADTVMAQWRLLKSGGWDYYVHVLEKT